jgi:hypothetical protein
MDHLPSQMTAARASHGVVLLASLVALVASCADDATISSRAPRGGVTVGGGNAPGGGGGSASPAPGGGGSSQATCNFDGAVGTKAGSVSASEEVWTGILVEKGQLLHFSAKGTWCWGDGASECSSADGTPGRPTPSELPVVVKGAYLGTLSMGIGSQVEALGASATIESTSCGELVLFMNDRPDYYGDNSGSLVVTVTHDPPL